MNETIENKTSQKRTSTRKPDPIGRILAEIRAAAKEAGEQPASPAPEHRRAHNLGRSAAWAKQYVLEGTVDALILKRAFEAASTGRRVALVQLASVAIAEIEKLDGGK